MSPTPATQRADTGWAYGAAGDGRVPSCRAWIRSQGSSSWSASLKTLLKSGSLRTVTNRSGWFVMMPSTPVLNDDDSIETKHSFSIHYFSFSWHPKWGKKEETEHLCASIDWRSSSFSHQQLILFSSIHCILLFVYFPDKIHRLISVMLLLPFFISRVWSWGSR